jgi:branched-chain amino acid transport system ATP-binding protein
MRKAGIVRPSKITVHANLEVVNEIFRIIRRINPDGTTVLLVEQNVKEAIKVFQYTHVLETGKIVLNVTTAELLENPKIKESFLGQKA